MPPWRSIIRSGSVGARLREGAPRQRTLRWRRTALGAHGQVVQHQVLWRRGHYGRGSAEDVDIAFWVVRGSLVVARI